MATSFTPFFQVLDGNGAPYAGAKLYFYRTGTSTPQSTYSQSDLDPAHANTNPVVADSAGRFGPVYFGTAFDYKAILKTSADVTIATFDPIFTSGPAGRTAVADASYALVVSDRLIAYTSISAARSVSLLPASTYEAGTLLTIVDESGSASSTKAISVVPNGTDTINGANATRTVIAVPYGSATLESDGTSKWTVVRSMMGPSRSYLAGLTTSNNVATPNTKLDVAAGSCADDTNVLLLTVAAGTIDCTTNGANGLDAGSLANSTWYHAFAIGKTDSTTALLASTSISAPTFPAGYTLKRRIGSFKTDGSAHIIGFVQDGDEFRWKTAVRDISSTNPGTGAVDRTLASTPLGLRVLALINIIVDNAGADFAFTYISDKSQDDVAPNSGFTHTSGSSKAGGEITVWTNTAQVVRSRISFSDASTGFGLNVRGWRDTRGRDG